MYKYTINLCLISMTIADMALTTAGQAGRYVPRGFTGTDLTSTSNVYCKLWFYIVSWTGVFTAYVLVGKKFDFYDI